MSLLSVVGRVQRRFILRSRFQVAVTRRGTGHGRGPVGPGRDEADAGARLVGRGAIGKVGGRVVAPRGAGVHAVVEVGDEEGRQGRVGRVAVAVDGVLRLGEEGGRVRVARGAARVRRAVTVQRAKVPRRRRRRRRARVRRLVRGQARLGVARAAGLDSRARRQPYHGHRQQGNDHGEDEYGDRASANGLGLGLPSWAGRRQGCVASGLAMMSVI